MAAIVLGTTPKNFKKIVEFPMLDGSIGKIECLYKYRTVKQFGQFIDEQRADAAKVSGAVPQAAETLEGFFAFKRERNAEYILQILDGWNLDVDLSLASAQQLLDEIPAAANAIIDDYRAAVVDGRLGN